MSNTDEIENTAGRGDQSGKVSLKPGGTHVSEDKLMAYLDGKLSPGDAHDIEKWLADEGMESDALEGLKSLEAHEVKHSVKKLNNILSKKLNYGKREKKRAKPDYTSLLAIALILLLAIVAFLVIKTIR